MAIKKIKEIKVDIVVARYFRPSANVPWGLGGGGGDVLFVPFRRVSFV